MQHPSQDAIDSVFRAICMKVDTPKSLALYLAHKYRSPDFFKLGPDPSIYNDAHSFSTDYLCYSFLSKRPDERFGIDCEDAALGSFKSAELRCGLWNRMLKNGSLRGFPPRAESWIFQAQRQIATILGPFDPKAVLGHCRWGPGATATISRRRGYRDTKHCSVPFSVTSSALPWFKLLLESDPHWFEAVCLSQVEGPFSVLPNVFDVIDHNKVVTVPKNAKTNRTIACEPTANSYLQQGCGRYIRKRLKRFGIDLDNQEINKSWASLACDLDLATLDLSSASDTISVELVALLLPLDWFLFLSSFRTQYGLLPDGERVHYEKFSSMGNAFTFELESLLFYAICKAVCGTGTISVYGDDIVVPQKHASDVVEALEFFGFAVNSEKSFTSGRFFESCGGHYFDGIDVTPLYQKEEANHPVEISRCGNRLLRWAARSGLGVTLDPTVRSAWLLLHRHAVRASAPFIPICEEDGGFHVPYDEFVLVGRRYCCNRGFRVRYYANRSRRLHRRNDRAGLSLYFLSPVIYEPEFVRGSERYVLRERWIIPPERYASLTW